MSILDDAIREHLELKRAHGADDAELKKLEDEAFGPPQRPDEQDPLAEAPTEFLVAPDIGADEAKEEARTRSPNIADLQEAPEPLDAPAEEEHPATEQEAIADAGHSTEERHAIADQPTEIFDVEGEFEDAATESDAPSDEEIADAELAEPRLAPVDPLAGIDGDELEISDERGDDDLEEEDDDFFSEQRLSDELNQALATPVPGEPGSPPTEEAEAVVEVTEVDEDVEEEDSGEFAAADDEGEEEDLEEDKEAPGQPKEDLLEDTPDFLEDAPEDDNLWFEQKPPKDFDFDD
jgi:hypothetical protein